MESVQRTTVAIGDLEVSAKLRDFVESELLPNSGIGPSCFWRALDYLVAKYIDGIDFFLADRRAIQRAIDDWHRVQRDAGSPTSGTDEYEAFLRELAYIVPEGPRFEISPQRVDPEIADVAAPQLVVPLTNTRFVINAANARWGSLYDGLYSSDVVGPPADQHSEEERKSLVVDKARALLDEWFPLTSGSHSEADQYSISDGSLVVEGWGGMPGALVAPAQFAGYRGATSDPNCILLRNHSLHVEISIDREDPVGRMDRAGVSNVLMESATSAIMDLEDSVATVDADDKVAAYRNWLQLNFGSLEGTFSDGKHEFARALRGDREYVSPQGEPLTLKGRALLLARTVGLEICTDLVLAKDGRPIPESLLDDLVLVAGALHDLRGNSPLKNSSEGSIYLVKPKLHGPSEVRMCGDIVTDIEGLFSLPFGTVKIGLMDEERRTSANLRECIRSVRDRIVFINTGFLDRTGDEIHTSMVAGPVVRKDAMRSQAWMRAYEERNVAIGLECGFRGRGQIGKGMWTAPDKMAAMMSEKVDHPLSGATCAWVPSPRAATLHAIHYHQVDVLALQDELASQPVASLTDLLRIPAGRSSDWASATRRDEVELNAQSILGYVARWVGQGVGCSKVPDLDGVALMEDRATCRISSQHIQNWLMHGVVSAPLVMEVMYDVAETVDEQNRSLPGYRPMGPNFDGPAFAAAVELIFEVERGSGGYTESVLRSWRKSRKLLDSVWTTGQSVKSSGG